MLNNKDNEVQAIIALLEHPAGFDVDINGYLVVRKYEYPKWVVELSNPIPDSYGEKWICTEFDTPKEAAEYFVELRHKYQIGLDYEKIAIEQERLRIEAENASLKDNLNRIFRQV